MARVGQPSDQTFSPFSESLRQQGRISDGKPEGINIVAGVIGIAPAGHVHRRVDREPAQVCPDHLQQERRLVAPVGILDDVQAEDDRRPRLRSREDRMLQSPFPFRPGFVEASRINGMSPVLQGFRANRR